jgi:hypothetical protein
MVVCLLRGQCPEADTDAVIEAFGKNEKVKKILRTLFVAMAVLLESVQAHL